jgi:hypothetical protein
MYSISNKQRDDILTLLKAFAESSNDKSLQALNRCRRAMLLVRNLEKRKPHGKRLTLNK